MSRPFLIPIDLNGNEIQNVVIQNLGADPGSPVNGQVWYNSTSNQYKGRVNGVTVVLRDSNTTLLNADIDASAGIALSKLALDPLARGNHTGTQLASTVSDFNAAVQTNRLDQLTAPTAAVAMNNQKITGLLDGTAAQDAVTKSQLDSVSAGLDPKASVRATTTANITLSGTQTIDGVSVIAGDRVLVKDQTTGSANGIYDVAAGAWSRSSDADVSAEVTPGMFTFVEEGTANADTGWIMSTNGAVTLGTTTLSFTQFSSAGAITAGNGLTQVGNTIDVVGTAGRISVAADSIDIDAAYVGQTSITTLGTIATGVWNGTAIAVADGGTGATTASGARTNLGAIETFAVDVGDAAATSIVATHNLATKDVTVAVYDKATPFDEVYPEIQRTGTNSVTLVFTTAPTLNQYRCVVQG